MQPNDGPASAGEQLSNAPATNEPRPACATGSTGERLDDGASGTERGSAATEELPLAAGSTNGEQPKNSQTLARLITEGRRPRSRRFAELEPYRDVLLAERRAGASIRLMAESLARLGVAISEETLRVWLLKHKMPKRRRPRKKAIAVKPVPVVPAAVSASSFVPAWQRKGPRIARDDF